MELIVVIAIMAVLIGAAGFGLSLLVGTEAKQAVYKTEAQLNDVKTGTLTKAGEDLVIRYISVPDKKTDPTNYEAYAKVGIEKSGYYADKSIYTIVYNKPTDTTMRKNYTDMHEYSYIGARKVTITVYYGGKTKELGTDTALKIVFNRRTGALEDIEIGGNYGIDSSFTGSDKGAIEKIEFKAGMRTYTMTFTPITGKYDITTS